jgi:hypothetical protein
MGARVADRGRGDAALDHRRAPGTKVAEHAAELRSAALDGLVFNMPDPYDLEVLEHAGRALSLAASARPGR